MTTWLESLPFLSDKQREDLRSQDLDNPAAVRVLIAPMLASDTLGLGLTIGKAALLVAAAQESAPTPAAAPATVNVQIAEPPDVATRAARALEAAAADPTRIAALPEVGITRVVVGTAEQPESDAINVMATRAMLAHAASGAPVDSTWAGLRVLDVREVLAPRIFCNPRTGSALQDGKDPISLVPWADLGIEGLRLASYGYSRGLFDGRPEDAVFASVRDDAALRQRIAVMAKADKFELHTLDARLVWRPQAGGLATPERPKSPLRGGQSSNPWAALQALMLSCFSADELRRFMRYLPDGDALVRQLPGVLASGDALAAEAVDVLRRAGMVNDDLRRRLRAERPRRADQIDAVFDALGIA